MQFLVRNGKVAEVDHVCIGTDTKVTQAYHYKMIFEVNHHTLVLVPILIIDKKSY